MSMLGGNSTCGIQGLGRVSRALECLEGGRCVLRAFGKSSSVMRHFSSLGGLLHAALICVASVDGEMACGPGCEEHHIEGSRWRTALS